MAKKTDPDEVTLYDLDPKFQDRLLKWLTKGNVVVDVKPVEGGFEFTVDPGEKFTAPDFETGLCAAMGARYKTRLVNPEFSERVHACLSEHDASITFMSTWVYSGMVGHDVAGFKVSVSNRDSRGENADEDFEIALVLAEDEFLSRLSAHRLPPEDCEALEQALIPSGAARGRER